MKALDKHLQAHDAAWSDALGGSLPCPGNIKAGLTQAFAGSARAIPTRLLLVDDHTLVRDGLKALLSDFSDIEVVGEASDGWEAVRQVAALVPDVVLMDVSVRGLNGIEALRTIRSRQSQARVVMLTMHATSEYVWAAFEAGADGYVLKECSGSEVVAAVRSVRAGRRYVSAAIAEAMPDATSGSMRASPLRRLSARERQVLQLVVEGNSSAKIAAMVHLSPKTVETYRSRMMKKLGAADLPALVKFALQHGITSLD